MLQQMLCFDCSDECGHVNDGLRWLLATARNGDLGQENNGMRASSFRKLCNESGQNKLHPNSSFHAGFVRMRHSNG